MDWFLERLQQASPTLDYQDFYDYADDFKKLIELNIVKYSEQLETIFCDLCDAPHPVSPFRNNRDELVISCSGSRRVVNPDELKIWTINKEALIKNVSSKNPIIDKTLFEKTAFASPSNKLVGRYYVIKDDNGDYRFEDNLVYIKNKDATYAVIFDVTYCLKPQGGKIEYQKIIEQCKKRRKNINKKAILRALTGKDANLFKYVKGLKQEPTYNISLFVAMQNGKEIEFNNKK